MLTKDKKRKKKPGFSTRMDTKNILFTQKKRNGGFIFGIRFKGRHREF